MAVSHSVPAPVDFAAPQAPSSPFARPPRTYLGEVITRLRRNRTAMVGIGFITLLIVLAIATPWIAPYDYGRGALQDANKLPSAAHWLGTDALGRDALAQPRKQAYGTPISSSRLRTNEIGWNRRYFAGVFSLFSWG